MRHTFPKWNPPKGMNRQPETEAEFRPLLDGREMWAAGQLVGWDRPDLNEEDYNFNSWTTCDPVPADAADGHLGLRLGVLYEYAREGRKLRGLLLLLNPARKRKRWERYSGETTFEGLSEAQARSGLLEMVDALAFLAKPLAANLPFAEVWRTQRELVKQAIKAGINARQLRMRNGITSHWKFERGAPVELAMPGELETATTAHTLWWDGQAPKAADSIAKDAHQTTRPRQVVGGKEVIALRVDWANYRDEHLKECFLELVQWLRSTKKGGGKIPPEPQPDKKGKKADVLHKALTCLRAARVLHLSPTPEAAWELLGLNSQQRNKSEANYYAYAKLARTEFKRVFPFGEEPAHNRTPKRKPR